MKWQSASKEFVRIFFVHNQHIAVVAGKKPARSAEVDLIRVRAGSKTPTFSVVSRNEKLGTASWNASPDRYYLVKPLLLGTAGSEVHIDVRHAGGTERVRVESMAEVPSALLRGKNEH